MGKRGPQPTPTNTLKLRGSWRAGEREGEPDIEIECPEPPCWLSEAAVEHWRHLSLQAFGMGVMASAHSTGLALLCESLANYIELRDAVAETGHTTMTSKGTAVQNPLVGARNQAWLQVLKGLREFGMTPAALTNIRVTDEKPKAEQGKARFFTTGA